MIIYNNLLGNEVFISRKKYYDDAVGVVCLSVCAYIQENRVIMYVL